MTGSWPAIEAARARSRATRVPWRIVDAGMPVQAGSVHRAHLAALRRWPRWLHAGDDAVVLHAEAASRDAVLAAVNQRLREDGHIVAWRDEIYPVLDPAGGRLLATFERAASRFWGTLTFGAHCNGFVTDSGTPEGRPAHLWIARRALTKATDPGLRDNLVGGGVPHGQTPAQTVVREGWEEAGLTPGQMLALVPGRVAQILRDIPEGLQHERLSVFDLALPPGLVPRNQDGEVADIELLPMAEALACAAGDAMTVDASLVTLDFALRRHLLPADEAAALAERAAGLWWPAPAA